MARQLLLTTLKNAGLDGFLLTLVSVVVMASFWSEPGIYGGVIPLNNIGNYGISIIFFFYGLKLNPQKLQAGLSNWRLHIVVQLATFVLFPIIALIVMFTAGGKASNLLWLGFFFLASLPSTVSSSVVMVSIAKGNIPAAIFNASISAIIGVLITPLWMGIFLTTSGSADLGHVILTLVLQVFVPAILGMLLNRKFGWILEKYSKALQLFDQTIIVIIIYCSFCESFANNMFSGFSLWNIILLGMAMIAFFFLIYGIIYIVCKALHFNREDKITTLFCGSKKSLVHGTVMSKVLFPNLTSVGIILLPLMLYHALQLMVVNVIVRSMARNDLKKITKS
ncbi:MAG: bile acid:sodium symporter [Prevotellaceae bacterium]|jgi:sodium/bile acid cotransporter 7|nr:bile acid:sodium symporter [Prevotellaceae bacterium]